MPSGLKLLFLCLPWVFVAYGVTVLQEFVGFHNNSVPATARVVFVERSENFMTAEEAQTVMDEAGNWPLPAFLYQHENRRFFVGHPIVNASTWRYHHGELVDIRYNRLDPTQAQPVTVFKFWWTPGIFIIGGVLAYLSLWLAYFLVENPTAKLMPKFMRRKKGSLNLRRR